MKKMLAFTEKERTIYIESAEPGQDLVTGTSRIDDAIAAAVGSLKDQLGILHVISDTVVETFQEGKHKVEKIEVEFGVSLSGKGTIYVVETKAEATLKVTLSFTPSNL